MEACAITDSKYIQTISHKRCQLIRAVIDGFHRGRLIRMKAGGIVTRIEKQKITTPPYQRRLVVTQG
jgi:hypothetical protein